MQTIKQKLSSRKFWVALASIVSGVLMMFGYAETSTETIAGAIVAIGGAVGYMITEAVVDAKAVTTVVTNAEAIAGEIKQNEKAKEIMKSGA